MKCFLKSLGFSNERELDKMDNYIRHRHVAKGELLVREGTVCDELYFIKKGIVRSFYITETGDEHTYCITFENTFITALSSFISSLPTVENIHAITDTDLDIIHKEDLERLYDQNPDFLRMGKFLIEQQYIEMEQRFFSLQRDKGRERYLDLLQNKPEYLNQIPLQYLASYLGVTPRHLSRLRKEFVR